ncbi:hypothetical protein [Nostoc sp.]|uniref:hypothetical protein n=1 Tax=Nostoc sp. TaxID=1180 RepID=UPI002FFBB02B
MPTVQRAYAVRNFRYSTSLFSSPKRSLRLGTLYHRVGAAFPRLIFKGARRAVVIELVEMR